jgi:hypothetical protein
VTNKRRSRHAECSRLSTHRVPLVALEIDLRRDVRGLVVHTVGLLLVDSLASLLKIVRRLGAVIGNCHRHAPIRYGVSILLRLEWLCISILLRLEWLNEY